MQVHKGVCSYCPISILIFFIYIFLPPFQCRARSVSGEINTAKWRSKSESACRSTRDPSNHIKTWWMYCRSKPVLFLHVPSGLLPQFIGKLSRSYNCLIFRSVTSAQNRSGAHKAINLKFPRTLMMRCWRGFCPCEKSYCGEEIVVESITRNTWQSSRIWSYFQKLVYIGWCLLFLWLARKVRKTFNNLPGVSNLTADSCFCDEMLAFLIHVLASACFSKKKGYSQIIFI